MKASAFEASWRQIKRWAWRHLNLPHPGEKADRSNPAPVISGTAAQPGITAGRTRTLAEHRADQMSAHSAALGAARSAWEAHHKTSVTPPIDISTLFKTPVRRVHDGSHTITPSIIVDDAGETVEFLERAFGIRENYRLTTREGKVAHCELQLEGSILNLGESTDGRPAHGLIAQIHVDDSDALFDQAVSAGAITIEPMADTCFGSREGRLADPFGNVWIIAARTGRVSPAEMQRRMAAQGH